MAHTGSGSGTRPPVTGPARAARTKIHHGLVARDVEVVAARLVAPRTMRVTLGGAELATLLSLGPTDHVKVHIPDRAVSGDVPGPPRTARGAAANGAVHVRDYTVRSLRPSGPSGPEIDLDMVVHGATGPASAWAARAAAGQRLVVAGPKSSKLAPEDVESVLLAGDETALPAIARWLELLPADVPVRVLAEVDSADDEVYLPGDLVEGRPGLDVTWLRRRARGGLVTGLLEDAVRKADVADLMWCAGEAGALVGVRRHLRRELGLSAVQVELTGYWRRGVADFDHHAPIDPTDPD